MGVLYRGNVNRQIYVNLFNIIQKEREKKDKGHDAK